MHSFGYAKLFGLVCSSEVCIPLTNQAEATLLRLSGAAGAVLLYQPLEARTLWALTHKAVAKHSKLFHYYVAHTGLEHSIHQPVDIVFERVTRPDDQDGARKLSYDFVAREERRTQVLALLDIFVVKHSFGRVAAHR